MPDRQQNALGLILKALEFAAHKHRDQRRKDAQASPYINHPIALANVLRNEGGVDDPIVICAALLHDTVEDTETTAEELEREFGGRIRDIVLEIIGAWPADRSFNPRPSLHDITFQTMVRLIFGDRDSGTSRALIAAYQKSVSVQVGSWGPWRNFARMQPHIRELMIEGTPVRVLNIDGLLKTKTDYREKDLLDKRVLARIRDDLMHLP